MTMTFDGINDEVDLGAINILESQSVLTVSMWFKGTAAAQQDLGFQSAGNITVRLRTPSSGLTMRFTIANAGPAANVDSIATINDGNWHHVVGVYNGATPIDIYIDGVLDNTSAGNAPASTGTTGNDVSVGAVNTARFFTGDIDDVRVYDRALSAAEVATIFAARGTDGIVSGLIGRLLLNEGAPGTVASGAGLNKDISNNGNNGTPTNSPTFTDGILRFRRRMA